MMARNSPKHSPVILLALASATLLHAPQAGAADGGTAAEAVRYGIVVTGSELLNGVYADGHTYFITRTLRPLGLQCVGAMAVDDNDADLKDGLRFMTARAKLIIVTGGLGPTDSDITREALSEFAEIPIREHPDVLAAMSRRFNRPADQLRANLRQQTRVPVRGTYLKNRHGTAVGLVFESPRAVIVALPGPPSELQPMVRDELIPYLSKRFGTRMPGCSVTLRFVGLGESEIHKRIKDYVTMPSSVFVSSQFAGGRVDFTFSLPDDTPADRARLDLLKRDIAKHFGQSMYAVGDVTLEQRVIDLLAKRGETLALAEVASGGNLAATLSNTNGGDQVLAGDYVAPTIDKLRQLLGVSVAGPLEHVATTVAERTGGDWTLAVGEATRADGRYVTIAIRPPLDEPRSERVRFYGTSEMAQARLSTRLLDLLRRRLEQAPPKSDLTSDTDANR
jgi:nicotinamide-nucleotide amidase